MANQFYDLCSSGLNSGTNTPVNDGKQAMLDVATGFVRRRIDFQNLLFLGLPLASAGAVAPTKSQLSLAAGYGIANTFYAQDTFAFLSVKKGYYIWAGAIAILRADSKLDCVTTLGDETTATVPMSIGTDLAPTALLASIDISQAAGTLTAFSGALLISGNEVALVMKTIAAGVAGANPRRPRDGYVEIAVGIADLFMTLRANPTWATGLGQLQAN